MPENSNQRHPSRKLDFIFALNGLPLAGSGGSRIIVALVNCLVEKGYKVGIISLPREPWLHVLNNDLPIPWYQSLFLQLNDSPKTYRFFNKIFRFFLRSPSHFKLDGNVEIINGRALKNYEAPFFIATNFMNAVQLKSFGTSTDRIILFSQVDETNIVYSNSYSGMATEVYKSFPKKLFINREVTKRFPGTKKIGMAIDLSLYKLLNPIELRIPDSIIFIIRKGEQKDPETAIEAIDKIHEINHDARLAAFGNVDRSMIPSFVNYYFNPSDSEIVSLFNSNSIFVTTSVLEGYPAPPLEAMACGCAVVSTDSIGIREYIDNEENGFICPIKNPDMVAETVIKLTLDISKRKEIALNGYKTAMNHSYDNMMNNFLKLMNEFNNEVRKEKI